MADNTDSIISKDELYERVTDILNSDDHPDINTDTNYKKDALFELFTKAPKALHPLDYFNQMIEHIKDEISSESMLGIQIASNSLGISLYFDGAKIGDYNTSETLPTMKDLIEYVLGREKELNDPNRTHARCNDCDWIGWEEDLSMDDTDRTPLCPECKSFDIYTF